MKYALSILVFPLIVAGSLGQQANEQKPASVRSAVDGQVGLETQQHLLVAKSAEHYMQRAWYEYGTSQSQPPVTSKNEFVVVADATGKAKDFVSSHEQWLRQQSTDTAYLYSASPLKGLTKQRRQVRIAQQRAAYQQEAKALHALNNQGNFLIGLLNNSSVPVVFPTQDGSVFCVLQALDKSQQWRPVQYWQYSGCGNSYIARYLRPTEELCLLAKIPRTGNFKTKLRYKLGGIKQFYYSNEFEGRISYSEFAEPPGRYGRSATGQRVATFKLDSLPGSSFGRRAYPFHQGGKWGDSLPY